MLTGLGLLAAESRCEFLLGPSKSFNTMQI